MDWQQNTLYTDIHKAPPNLAKNYIPPNEQELYVRLTEVNVALEEIEEDEKVDQEKIDQYWVIYSDADSVIKRMEKEDTLPEGTSKVNLHRLHTYIQTETALSQAYDKVDIEQMEKLSLIFVDRLINEKNQIDQYYFNQLRELSIEYAELDQFSKEILNLLGVVENDILQVNIQVNKGITEDVLARIENKNMGRFKHIRNLVKVLESDSWSKILSHNTLTREYYSWKKSEEILKALLRTSYMPVSDFKTYEDVIQYDPTKAISERKGYELETDSSVSAVYYHGVKLNADDYIKKGITLTFDIDYKFTEIEIIEEDIKEDIEEQEDDETIPTPEVERDPNSSDKNGDQTPQRPEKPQVPQKPREPVETPEEDHNAGNDPNGNNEEGNNKEEPDDSEVEE